MGQQLREIAALAEDYMRVHNCLYYSSKGSSATYWWVLLTYGLVSATQDTDVGRSHDPRI